jgi:putative glutamine amidotransferase
VTRPLIGVCAAVEAASFGPWVDEPAVLMQLSYARSIQAAGGIAAMLPPDPRVAESPEELLDHVDALVVGGGADLDPASHEAEPHPETRGANRDRDDFELALTAAALDRGMPVLGVCRGMQVMNVAAGGTLDQHLPDRLGDDRHRLTPGTWSEHQVRLAPGSLAARAAGSEELTIKSHHHQGVGEVGDGFEAAAWADDDTVEAIESPENGFVLGVLWHPEEDPKDGIIPALIERASH